MAAGAGCGIFQLLIRRRWSIDESCAGIVESRKLVNDRIVPAQRTSYGFLDQPLTSFLNMPSFDVVSEFDTHELDQCGRSKPCANSLSVSDFKGTDRRVRARGTTCDHERTGRLPAEAMLEILKGGCEAGASILHASR